VAPEDDKMREARLRRFGHIRRTRSMDAPVWSCENIDRLDHRRSRGRLKNSWSEIIRHDLKIV